jgi:hypothetical protein
VESCYAVGFTNRGDNRLEQGQAKEAIAAYHERWPSPRTRPPSGAGLRPGADSTGAPVLARASHGQPLAPLSPSGTPMQSGKRGRTGDGDATLETARDRCATKSGTVDLEQGRLRWWAARRRPRRAFRTCSSMSRQSRGLWGWRGIRPRRRLGRRLRPLGAVRLLHRVVNLRAAYARELLRAGRHAPPGNRSTRPPTRSEDRGARLEGWWLWRRAGRGRPRQGGPGSDRSWCDLAASCWRGSRWKDRIRQRPGGRGAGPAPHRGRHPAASTAQVGRYDLVHTLPEAERRLIPLL